MVQCSSVMILLDTMALTTASVGRILAVSLAFSLVNPPIAIELAPSELTMKESTVATPGSICVTNPALCLVVTTLVLFLSNWVTTSSMLAMRNFVPNNAPWMDAPGLVSPTITSMHCNRMLCISVQMNILAKCRVRLQVSVMF